jgi:molybdopterin-guanine dinucleotide biosynthesis protein A
MGLFIGGRSSRMGHFPKGLLRCPGGSSLSIVEHWHSMAQTIGLECVLIGESEAYSHLGMPMLPDQPAGVGPIGGLHALLDYVLQRDGSTSFDAVAVACDMPYVTPPLLSRLCSHPSGRPMLAPRHSHTLTWEPLFARYTPTSALPLIVECILDRKHSLQALLDRAGAEVVPLRDSEWSQLRDWDRPADVEV